MVKVKIILSFFMILTMLFSLISCKPKNAEKPLVKQELRLNLGGEPTILNPILYTDGPSGEVLDYLYRGLLKVNEDLGLEPDICESYKISSDTKTYTFKLRKNVYWHDGVEVTAEDVKFTFDKILDLKTNTVRRSDYLVGDQPIKFRVLDKYTVQAELNKPFAPFLSNMTMGIIPKHIFLKEDINKSKYNREPIGNGPFVFKEWKVGQYVKLSRNEKYYLNKPKLETVILKIIPDTNTALVALEKGEIDLNSLPSKDYSRFKRNPNFQVFDYYTLYYLYLSFNLKNPLFRDLKNRQAIAMAINKPAIVQAVYQQFAKSVEIPSSPASWAYPKLEPNFGYDYNPQKSKQLLAEQGFVLNPKTQVLEKNKQPFAFTLVLSKGSQNASKIAQIIQEYLRQVGIKMEINQMEWSSFIKLTDDPIDPKKFEAVLLGWSMGLDPDVYSIWHSSEYPKGFNFIGYKNKIVDELLVKGREEVLPEKRKEIYQQLYSEIGKDLPYLFLFNVKALVAVNKKVQGLSKPGPAGILNRIEDINISK